MVIPLSQGLLRKVSWFLAEGLRSPANMYVQKRPQQSPWQQKTNSPRSTEEKQKTEADCVTCSLCPHVSHYAKKHPFYIPLLIEQPLALLILNRTTDRYARNPTVDSVVDLLLGLRQKLVWPDQNWPLLDRTDFVWQILSNADNLGTKVSVLISEVSLWQSRMET